jgi:hypothetical protein
MQEPPDDLIYTINILAPKATTDLQYSITGAKLYAGAPYKSVDPPAAHCDHHVQAKQNRLSTASFFDERFEQVAFSSFLPDFALVKLAF